MYKKIVNSIVWGDFLMKRKFRAGAAVFLLFIWTAGLLSGCAQDPRKLDKSSPVTLTLWHYYNGAQKQIFDELVTEFNEGVGAEQGVVVEAFSQGTVNELSAKVIDAIDQKVGSGKIPDIFAAYADTAYEIYKRGKAADIGQYFTKEDLAAFVPEYLSEGEFETGRLMIIPVAKSTEIFMLNKTDWDAFASATGASEASFATWEGLAEVAKAYYEYTDGLTETPGDGKSFFGRDVMANYMIVGSLQLGVELFEVKEGKIALNIDKDATRRLWDNYYVPYVNGYYASIGRFRSDDAKTGDIIALVGATTGVPYFPREVTSQDATTYPIESAVYPVPNFEGTQPCAAQQGAGMVVTKTTEKQEYASSLFLKWFTAPKQNLRFSIRSGYMPVRSEANTTEALDQFLASSSSDITPLMKDALYIGADTVQNSRMYTSKAFENGSNARNVLADALQNKASQDAAEVKALIESGMSHAQAVQGYVTDANFDGWFESFSAELNAAVAG